MPAKINYKTSKKYACPFCDFKAMRVDLVAHVDKNHEEMIPEGYSAARCVYDAINGKNYGTCMICKCKVYNWNDKINRYYNLCDKPSCRAEVRRNALERHMRVYNKPTLLNDPEHQEKMLANRKISGTYTFKDGGKVGYTGKYEKNALEFMDLVLDIPSKDIQTPGPVLEYEYNGEIHKWITDIYYIPANLLIEVKDGGKNPNNRSMESYREKQVAKETMVTNLGTYNYLRLTDNNFAQLLAIFADMKNEALTSESPAAKIHINEEVGGMPVGFRPSAYIVPCGMNNVFDSFAYGDSTMGDSLYTVTSGTIDKKKKKDLEEEYELGPSLYYEGDDVEEKMRKVYKEVSNNNSVVSPLLFAKLLVNENVKTWMDAVLSENVKRADYESEKLYCQMISNAAYMKFKESTSMDSNVISTKGSVYICMSPKGYYATTPDDHYLASEYFSDMESLERSGVIDIMNNMYRAHFQDGGTPDEHTV